MVLACPTYQFETTRCVELMVLTLEKKTAGVQCLTFSAMCHVVVLPLSFLSSYVHLARNHGVYNIVDVLEMGCMYWFGT